MESLSDGSGRLWDEMDLGHDQEALLRPRPLRRYPSTRITENFPEAGNLPRRLSLPNAMDCQIVFGDEELITQQIRTAQRMRNDLQIRKYFLYFGLATIFLVVITIILAIKLFYRSEGQN